MNRIDVDEYRHPPALMAARRGPLASIWIWCWLASLGCTGTAVASDPEAESYTFMPEESALEVRVPSAGFLGFMGHDHTIDVREFRGALEWNSDAPEEASLWFDVSADSLWVRGEGENEGDRPKIQGEMESPSVLDVAEYPRIRFESTRIEPGSQGAWEIQGDLTLRGESHDVTFEAQVAFPESNRVTASGSVEIRPERWGIEPITALAGTVRTADVIELRFTVEGEARKQ